MECAVNKPILTPAILRPQVVPISGARHIIKTLNTLTKYNERGLSLTGSKISKPRHTFLSA